MLSSNRTYAIEILWDYREKKYSQNIQNLKYE